MSYIQQSSQKMFPGRERLPLSKNWSLWQTFRIATTLAESRGKFVVSILFYLKRKKCTWFLSSLQQPSFTDMLFSLLSHSTDHQLIPGHVLDIETLDPTAVVKDNTIEQVQVVRVFQMESHPHIDLATGWKISECKGQKCPPKEISKCPKNVTKEQKLP